MATSDSAKSSESSSSSTKSAPPSNSPAYPDYLLIGCELETGIMANWLRKNYPQKLKCCVCQNPIAVGNAIIVTIKYRNYPTCSQHSKTASEALMGELSGAAIEKIPDGIGESHILSDVQEKYDGWFTEHQRRYGSMMTLVMWSGTDFDGFSKHYMTYGECDSSWRLMYDAYAYLMSLFADHLASGRVLPYQKVNITDYEKRYQSNTN
jgi:hypothetical protein